MAKKTHIDVKVSIDSIRDQLRKMLVSGHSKLISDVIISNLEVSEIGLEQLFKAFSGIEDKPKYKTGDRVAVVASSLYSWDFDEADMVAAGLMHQGRVRCQIVDITPLSRLPYKVKYNCIKGPLQKDNHSWTDEAHICLEEDWPENFTDLPDAPF